MNLQTMKNIKITTAVFMLSFGALATSCRSTDNAVDNPDGNGIVKGNAAMAFNLLGEEYAEEKLSTQASVKNKSFVTDKKEQTAVFMAGDQPVIATLTPMVSSLNTQASINPMAAGPEIKPLIKAGLKYRVIAYKKSDGTKADSKVYTIDTTGKSVSDDGTEMMLNGDNETINKYDFVALSYNSATAPADVTGTLSSASLGSISGNNDLMYFRANDVRVSKGDNVLNIVLKHQFSLITTVIDASAVAPGSPISSIGNGITIDRHRGSANNSIKLSNGAVTFGTTGITTKAVTFTAPATSSAVWESDPVLVANPGGSATEMATLTFPNNASGTITVGGKTKRNFNISNLVVTPGVKYALKLKFACTEDATPTWPFSMSDSGNTGNTVLTRTFNAPAADAGFVFDVYQLDNSFNMKINGVDLATQEIQFQSGVDGYPRNIRFKSDGAQWGASGIPQIYSLGNSTNSIPIIRITIGPDGSVSMMGRRTTASNLEPLELYGGTQFNKIIWKTTGSNEVISTMLVTGETIMRGLGVGKKIKPCS